MPASDPAEWVERAVRDQPHRVFLRTPGGGELTRMRVKPRPYRAGMESAETPADLLADKAVSSAVRCTVE
jgi:hypothetical protein